MDRWTFTHWAKTIGLLLWLAFLVAGVSAPMWAPPVLPKF